MAAAPRVASSWAAAPLSKPGMASNQRRTISRKEAFTTSADSTALPGAGAPAWAGGSHKMQRKQGRFRQQAYGHQRGCDPGDWLRSDARGQQHDIERTVSTKDQHRAQQIEHGTEQREQQIAQCCPDRFAATIQADQWHGRKRQQLQGDVKIEKIPPRATALRAAQIASSKIQKTSGARRSGSPPAG